MHGSLAARLLAREVIKAKLKQEGHELSSVAAKDITAAAEELYKYDPARIERALFDAVQTILTLKTLSNPAKRRARS